MAVSNSRPQKSRNQTWRRRLCTGCGAVFTSYETIDLSQAIIVSYGPDKTLKPTAGGERRQPLRPFSRDKLFISLYKSLQHRPDAASDAGGLCDTVVAHIIGRQHGGQIAARIIAGISLNTLRRFDAAAATHYAAFHHYPGLEAGRSRD